jgi:16S rRNA (cytosine1402-N4)-methyltransferase
MTSPHLPVLLNEVVDLFSALELRQFVDGTLGAGGHAQAILTAHPELNLYLGIDQDSEARELAAQRLAAFSDQLRIVSGNFRDLAGLLQGQQVSKVDGILLDLGVSSMQLDRAERGFSFMNEGPLDMRMDPTQSLNAATICNTWEEGDIRRILREYGEEPRASRVARAIVRERPFVTTADLVAAIRPALRYKEVSRKHPATRTFQALRIAVNSELDVVREVLPQAIELLRPGGVLAVITFHSLEDRIVKHWFQQAASDKQNSSGIGGLFLDKDPLVKLVNRKPIGASEQEQNMNARSRSAKLRAVIKLDHS